VPGVPGAPGDASAIVDATFWTVTPHAGLVNERALNALANGYVKSTAGEPSTIAVIPVADGGTGGTTPSTARTNLGVGTVGTLNLNGDANTFLNGVGAWTTPAGAVGVPSGMVGIFGGACPPGWTRVTGWDGRFLRANATAGAMGGSSTHSHDAGSLTAAAHAHGPGTFAGPNHNHGGSVNVNVTVGGSTGGGGTHSHPFSGSGSGVTAGSNQGTMNVDAGGSGFMSRGDHMHNFSVTVGGDTSSAGDHNHPFGGSGSGSGNISNDGGQGITGTSAAIGAAVTGATAVVNHEPLFVDVVYCIKD
jgi:hypothetical protein